MRVKVKVGDIKRLPNKSGEDFIVKVINLFTYEGKEYAEVEPIEFKSFSREVPTYMLFNI